MTLVYFAPVKSKRQQYKPQRGFTFSKLCVNNSYSRNTVCYVMSSHLNKFFEVGIHVKTINEISESLMTEYVLLLQVETFSITA